MNFVDYNALLWYGNLEFKTKDTPFSFTWYTLRRPPLQMSTNQEGKQLFGMKIILHTVMDPRWQTTALSRHLAPDRH